MSWKSLVNRAVRIGVREGVRYLKDAKSKNESSTSPTPPRDGGSRPRPGTGSPSGSGRGPQHPAPQQSGTGARAYPGDYRGAISVSYSPDLDGDADPGEVVWGWIPYEEDHSQGKDRPSLVVGRDDRWVLVLMLTSKDHIPGGFGEVREDRNAKWMNIGSGDWDSQGRPSEIRLDRVIRVDPNSIRREGAIMPREVFEKVAANIES